eukprot:Tbor_TRINITY_DN4656_c0_g1::TRINITY_DN4656_c0_g1_i1::g.14827::m.14827
MQVSFKVIFGVVPTFLFTSLYYICYSFECYDSYCVALSQDTSSPNDSKFLLPAGVIAPSSSYWLVLPSDLPPLMSRSAYPSVSCKTKGNHSQWQSSSILYLLPHTLLEMLHNLLVEIKTAELLRVDEELDESTACPSSGVLSQIRRSIVLLYTAAVRRVHALYASYVYWRWRLDCWLMQVPLVRAVHNCVEVSTSTNHSQGLEEAISSFDVK